MRNPAGEGERTRRASGPDPCVASVEACCQRHGWRSAAVTIGGLDHDTASKGYNANAATTFLKLPVTAFCPQLPNVMCYDVRACSHDQPARCGLVSLAEGTVAPVRNSSTVYPLGWPAQLESSLHKHCAILLRAELPPPAGARGGGRLSDRTGSLRQAARIAPLPTGAPRRVAAWAAEKLNRTLRGPCRCGHPVEGSPVSSGASARTSRSESLWPAHLPCSGRSRATLRSPPGPGTPHSPTAAKQLR